MRLRLSVSVIVLAACLSCRSSIQNHPAYRLPSGKEIKVTSVERMDFPNSDPALVMNYLTDIPIDDRIALRQEVDEIWRVFQQDIEKAHLKAGVIRANHAEGGGVVKTVNGYGFVFVKEADNKWRCLDDNQPKK